MTLKFVTWFNKTFKLRNMNTLSARANNNYENLRVQVSYKLQEIERFLNGDYSLMIPSSTEYAKMVRNYKRIDDDCFSYSIHGKTFLVKTEYEDLHQQGVAIISTFETKPIHDNYPNMKLTHIKSLDLYIDKLGNSVINDKAIQGNVALKYFDSVTNHMYPIK